LDQFESKLFNVLVNHFSEPMTIHKLEMAAEFAYALENWFQIEIIVALVDAEIFVTTKGKMDFDADIVVGQEEREVGIELRFWRLGMKKLESALDEHPYAGLCLFLFRNDNNKLLDLKDQLKERDIVYQELNAEWVLMLVKGASKR